MIFTHWYHVAIARFTFCWGRHNRLLMMSQWPDNCDAITWIVVSHSLDIKFIPGDIQGRSCKKFQTLTLFYFLLAVVLLESPPNQVQCQVQCRDRPMVQWHPLVQCQVVPWPLVVQCPWWTGIREWCKYKTAYIDGVRNSYHFMSLISLWKHRSVFAFYPSALRAGGVLSSRSGLEGGRVAARLTEPISL